MQRGQQPQRICMTVATAEACARDIRSEPHFREQALQSRSVDHFPIRVPVAPLIVKALQRGCSLLERIRSEAERQPAVLFIAKWDTAPVRQFVRKSPPEPDALPRERLVGRHAEPFALQPYQTEIGARGPEVAVVAVKQENPPSAQCKTVRNRRSDCSRTNDDNI